MCGIAALVGGDDTLEPRIDRMVAALAHRGPDAAGTVVLGADGVALGARRLSVLDLEGGAQPMWDEERRHCVVFNGEIYNSPALRRQLEARGRRFATARSDTEVLAVGFAEWGAELFRRLDGMFAVAIWDRVQRRLVVARDRFGEKPLYVARLRRGYAVASEMKALRALDDGPPTLDLVSLDQYLAYDYVLSPRTILANVSKLPGGDWGVVTESGCTNEPYATLDFDDTCATEDQLLERLDAHLDAAVRSRLLADVPVGLFLSGGLDSTTVGWYMTRQRGDVHSFSVAFDESEFDESGYARLAAASLGTTHHVERLSERRAAELLPRVPELLDEPMGDQSILPTYALSVAARRDVTVALGGDGSDELLMGYQSYRPLAAASPQMVLRRLASYGGDARAVLAPAVRAALPLPQDDGAALLARRCGGIRGPADEAVATFLRAFLQESVLVKVDRGSMAASLEVRAPFLARELAAFLLAVPPDLKIRGGTGKHLLRRLMRGRIPDPLIDRHKQGFRIPLARWLRGQLRPLAQEYLAPARLEAGGLVDAAIAGRLLAEHLEARADRSRELWLLLQLELWRERWLPGAAV